MRERDAMQLLLRCLARVKRRAAKQKHWLPHLFIPGFSLLPCISFPLSSHSLLALDPLPHARIFTLPHLIPSHPHSLTHLIRSYSFLPQPATLLLHHTPDRPFVSIIIRHHIIGYTVQLDITLSRLLSTTHLTPRKSASPPP